MATQSRKKRVPRLKYSDCRGIGWHVSYRDPDAGTPRRHRFGMVTLAEAESAYHEWVAAHLRGDTPPAPKRHSRRKLDEHLAKPKANPAGVPAEVLPGSLLHIASGFFAFEEGRISDENGARRQGTITQKTCETRKQFAQEFLKFLNSRNGQGAVGRMKLADLTMQDVEGYNRLLVSAGYSSSQVTKRLQVVKAIIDRGGRPEYGQQLLAWNWDSRDVSHGKPGTPRRLPTLTQLKLVLKNCDAQRTAMVWMAIGCGFGQRDLAEVRVGQFDEIGYDLRRGKTGIERYGETPKMVWKTLQEYLAKVKRPEGGLLFLTRKGMPLVHGHTDSVVLWWTKLRAELGEAGEGLGGFYTLRHLGGAQK